MSGAPRAMETIIENACHGGKVAILGIFPERFSIDWDKVIFSMLTIKGIYGREMYETWYKMTTMIQSGLEITPVITHRLGYTEFAEGFAAMASGEAGKVVLDWT
jgi:threonine 3-dehydrogenase